MENPEVPPIARAHGAPHRGGYGHEVAHVTGAMRRLPAVFGADLWLVDLTAPLAAPLAILSSAERARAERLVFEDDRRRFRASHVALRVLLAPTLGCDPAGVEFHSGPHDKPFVAGSPGVCFNMSHSGERALVAIAREMPAGVEIGVDIEALRGVSNVSDLAAAHFTAREQRELSGCAPGAIQELFLSGWTRKEACLKAVGSGLSIAPSTFDCALAPGRSRTSIATPAGVVDIDIESIDVEAGYLAAIAITRPAIARPGITG